MDALWRLPADVELWLILAYVVGVLAGARIIESIARLHFQRARRYAEHGFEYNEPRDHYHCLGGATLTRHSTHPAERLAIYRAPVEHCGGCRLKPHCAPLEDSRRIYRSLATWTETDIGRFHLYISVLMYVVAAVLTLAGICNWQGRPGLGYLALAFTGSLACLLLQARRLQFRPHVSAASAASETPI